MFSCIHEVVLTETPLERIQTMGDLGAKYGFFGEDPGMGGAGEAVTLVDKTGEAWVFHICGGWAGWGGGGDGGNKIQWSFAMFCLHVVAEAHNVVQGCQQM